MILNGTTWGIASGSLGDFDTVNPGTDDVLIKYTYYGDANLDGRVTSADYTRIDGRFLGGLTGWGNGDFNYDGVVNGSDYTLIDNAFNTQAASLAATAPNGDAVIATAFSSIASVPEPLMLGQLLLSGIVLSRRRSAPCFGRGDLL